MDHVKRGHLRLVPAEPQPLAAAAGGGGSGGSTSFADWTIIDNTHASINGRTQVVKIAGWHRHPIAADAHRSIERPPDWLCEAAEPDHAVQLARYVGSGVGHVWLLDHAARTIDAYRLGPTSWTHVGSATGNSPLRAEPFAAVELELSSLWDDVV